MWQKYLSPTTLDDTLRLLAQHGSEARLVAGGTDLILEIESKLRQPSVLIDITRVYDLGRITQTRDGVIHLGPLVTHSQVIASRLIVENAFPLAQACWSVGTPQIRNRGTIAGNIVTASPANDTITPLMALGASVTLASVRGRRTVPLQDLLLSVREVAMAGDEMLVDIEFPAMRPDQHGMFIKFGLRRALAISLVNVVAVVSLESGRIRKAAITLGSVAPTVIHAAQAELLLTGECPSEEIIARAAEQAMQACRPIDDMRASAAYRKELARVVTARALRAAAAGREREGWSETPVVLWGKTDGHFPAGPANTPVEHSSKGDELIEVTINGELHRIRGANHKTLIRLLREDAGLTGTKKPCAEGECGGCTVLLDGIAVLSCLVPAPRAHMAEIVTVEVLAQDDR
ncbi:MAG: FAD binding domain-containing protein, partial [Chloroflexota bacterium]